MKEKAGGKSWPTSPEQLHSETCMSGAEIGAAELPSPGLGRDAMAVWCAWSGRLNLPDCSLRRNRRVVNFGQTVE